MEVFIPITMWNSKFTYIRPKDIISITDYTPKFSRRTGLSDPYKDCKSIVNVRRESLHQSDFRDNRRDVKLNHTPIHSTETSLEILKKLKD